MNRYIASVAGAWSQFLNATLGGNRDQSFSSRSYEAALAGRWWGKVAVAVIDLLFVAELDHCRAAYLSDDERSEG